MINLTFKANSISMLAIILPALLVSLFIWGAYRVYKKKSRKWFHTLRIFFFFGVVMMLITTIRTLIAAFNNPVEVYNQTAAIFFSMVSFQFDPNITTRQALSCWITLSSMMLIPLIPIWFLFSNVATALNIKRKKVTVEA